MATLPTARKKPNQSKANENKGEKEEKKKK